MRPAKDRSVRIPWSAPPKKSDRSRAGDGTPVPPGPWRGGITWQPASCPGRTRGGAFLAGRASCGRRAELRCFVGGALVERPVLGSAPKRWRQGSASANGPRRAKEKPARRRIGEGARSTSPLRPPAEAALEPAAWRDRGSGGPPSGRRRRVSAPLPGRRSPRYHSCASTRCRGLRRAAAYPPDGRRNRLQ